MKIFSKIIQIKLDIEKSDQEQKFPHISLYSYQYVS